MKALSKERERRYQSAGDLSRDLGHYLSGEPIEARRDSSWYLLKKTLSLHRRAVGVAVGLVAVIVAALIVSTVFWRQAVDERNHAQQAADDAQQAQAAEATQRAEAERLAELSRRRMVQLLQAEGTRLMMAGDLIGSLHPFVEALRLDQGDPEREEMHRIRLGTILRQCPKLAAIHVFDDPPFFTDGEHIVTRNDESVRVWDALSGRPLSPSLAHADVVHVSFSPDGRLLATSGEDNAARIWVVATGKLVGAPLTHDGVVAHTRFSADGTRVVTASFDRTARVWDVGSGRPITPPLAHDGGVNDAGFSPNGRLVATASRDEYARLWNVVTGEPVGVEMRCGEEVYRIAFSADGQFLATAAGYGVLQLWDPESGESLCAPVTQSGSRGVYVGPEPLFTPDGHHVATCGTSPIRLVSVPDGKPALWCLRHNESRDSIRSVSFDAVGRFIATAGIDRSARIWDAHTGALRAPILNHAALVQQASFHPDGRHLVTLLQDGTVRIWDLVTQLFEASPVYTKTHAWSNRVFLQNGRSVYVPVSDALPDRCQSSADVDPPFEYCDFLPKGDLRRFGGRMLREGANESVIICDAKTHAPLAPPLTHKATVYTAVFSPQGDRLVTVSWSAARVWDVSSGAPLTRQLRGRERIRHARFSLDGQRLLTTGTRSAQLWSIDAGEPVAPVLEPGGTIKLSWYNDAGARILVVDDSPLQVWDVAARSPAWTWSSISDSITEVALSPDESYVLVITANGEMRLLETATGRPRDRAMLHGARVSQVCFSPDGSRIATSDVDYTLRIWDVGNGTLVTRPMKLDNYIWKLEFSTDNRHVLAVSEYMDYLFDAGTGELVMPPVKTTPSSYHACLSTDGHWLVTFDDVRDVTHAIDLTAVDWPLGDLALMADVLSGHTCEASGALLPVEIDELLGKWRFLDSGHPRAFESTPEQIARWHACVDAEEIGRAVQSAYKCEAAEDWAGAIRQLNVAIELDPEVEYNLCRRGRAHFKVGNIQAARRDFSRALELMNDDNLLWRYDDNIAKVEAGGEETFQQAKELVRHLYRSMPLQADVLAALHAKAGLGDRLRAAAEILVRGRPDDARILHSDAWEIVRSPGNTAQEYEVALRKAEEMFEREPYQGEYLNTLGVAQYRVGDYAAALDTLTWADEINVATREGGRPTDVAFIAMSLYQLGRQAEALDALERLRALVRALGEADTEESRGFLREAESLIAPPDTHPGLSP